MKVIITIMVMAVLALSVHAEIFVLNTISETISRIDKETGAVNNTFAVTGIYPNKMAVTEDYIYLTNSGDNSVQKIDASTGATLDIISVEQYSNPYDLVSHGDYLYVTGFLSNKVYKISKAHDLVIDEVEVGVAPQGLMAHNGKLFVANCGFEYPNYLPGEVSVIDLDSFTVFETISVAINPQRMSLDETGNIHLVCTGDYADNMGVVVVIDSESHQIIEEISFNSYTMNIAISGLGRVYIGDAFGSGVFAYDLPDFDIVYDSVNSFSSGSSALLVHNQSLIVADAGDFMSNSSITVYDLDEAMIADYTTAIGAIDVAVRPVTTNIEESLVSSPLPRMSVFPNPFSSTLQIAVDSEDRTSNADSIVEIYNLRGQKIRTIGADMANPVWDGRDSAGKLCSSGIYLIRLTDDRGNLLSSTKVTFFNSAK
jgi:DNA-binding beta-propeller fold protein YncE